MRPDPVATYRLQLRPEFGLDAAAGLVSYLDRLGVSHVYLSPCLQAVRGSAHGYDVVDPTRVNEDLGGEAARRRLCDALEAAGMGQMLDIVPNHMAVAGDQNPWWWDVLENGPSSRYALYFDVDWEASEERWPNKVLLPVLGDHYGRILEAQELQVRYGGGVFTLQYHEHAFPLDPSTLSDLLCKAYAASDSELLGFIAESCARLPRPHVTLGWAVERRHRDKDVIRRLLVQLAGEEPEAHAAILDHVDRINQDPDALDELIEKQNYRLAWWRTAGRDLGYRRFFDINDLAGLRVEEEEVFEAIHALPIRWARAGEVHGLRIDHPDGLRDPAQYFDRLHRACPDAWVVVEKILEPGESLPADWPVAGTTGYDFLNLVQGLFVDPAGEVPLSGLLEELSGESADFAEQVHDCKRQVVKELLGSELNRLVSLFVEICERHRRHRDYTRHELYQALLEVASCFPVYRTYVRHPQGEVSEADVHYVTQAIDQARERRPELDAELFDFLHGLLLLRIPGDREAELAMRFQQLTGPAMAKGVEDTAFYRFHRLIALNEVGGDPACFGVSVEAFHAACADARAHQPLALLATSTHDTKRSEDVRARLLLLSEMPEAWSAVVSRWREHNATHRRDEGPDPATEYLLYQTLVGAWPIDAERASDYMEKAVREAKLHTSWTQPNEAYEAAVRHFVNAVLEDDGFRADLDSFVKPLVTPGRINGLSQTLLKLTAPGVPDIYQGAELWDLSLVDPDNRRPVDFALRERLLTELEGMSVGEILARSDKGLPKLWVIRQALQLRRHHPAWLGGQGDYQPLELSGARAAHGVAFLRGEGVAVLAPRLVHTLGGDWGDTVLHLPPGHWHNVLTAEPVDGGDVSVAHLLAPFPVALLVREEDRP
ncbi:malto-oligosyltrehalose synthase [Thioalkalivibrio denitrificans]|uniref:Malto-oligosyltrehalose synthase n=1 Tax=Thioalkalivibrio denitrificans TaxID=108003 RepID=A0A1V3NBE9_9GAMM|nr:malto-oligosyltrehalose synthase [Thioalkalivibrio denitrificans]OOG22429.1 malto-oligosyltrehalose synthase [Thioalkalivibrio denitrificans]